VSAEGDANQSHGSAPVNSGMTPLIEGQAVVDAVLAASRVFVAVASNALVGTTPQVTLPQFRALVLLEQHGPLSLVDLAEELGVVPSTASRMCDRLVAKKLVRRGIDQTNRRRVTLRLQPAGRALVEESTRRRKREIARLLHGIAKPDQDQLATALKLLVTAANG
jgi:DNA-binding MarR family transcriptional regulator